MKPWQKFAEDLLLKEDRISAWETYGLNTGLLDRETILCKIPKVEYWYLDE